MLKQSLALGAMLLSAVAFAETSYICVADFGAILYFNEKTKSWGGSGVQNPNKKYLISRPDKNGRHKKYAWEFKEIGEEIPIAFCEDDFNEAGYLVCPSFYDMNFNKNTGKFLLIYSSGYWTDDPNAKEGELHYEGADMPHMLAGKCSPI